MFLRNVFPSAVLCAGGMLLSLTGCLNLGGRTTYVHETPETKSRLQALETRVGALEQAFQTTSGTVVQEVLPGQ